MRLSSKNDAWFLSTAPVADFFGGNLAAPSLSGPILNNLQIAGTQFVQMGLLSTVQQASGGLTFSNTSVEISGEMVASSQIAAEALAAVVNFLTGLILLNPDNDPQSRQIASVIQMARVTAQDGTMQLALSVPEAIMEQVLTTPPQIVVKQTLSRDLQNNVVVSLTLTNIGVATAEATIITVAQIGSKLASVVPAVPVDIPGGSAAPMTVVFPASVGSPGTNTTLTVGGTYVGGSFNFTSRITLP